MCMECRHTPCHPACPNYDPEPVYTCKMCGEAIEDGEEYYELNGEYYCAWCFEDNAVEILVNECGATKGVADADI